MPANNHRAAAQMPASPRNTAKYTNKDGSKFITVPKGTASETSQPSTPTAAKSSSSQPDAEVSSCPAPTVNRKKQKRRQKAAAKAAALAANGQPSPASTTENHSTFDTADHDLGESDDEHEYIIEGEPTSPTDGLSGPGLVKKGKKKKKKKGVVETSDSVASGLYLQSRSSMPARGPGMSRDKIWSTNNQEERERIKEFWLGLGEDERRSLVKVEKDAVLKKMKEQQKHTCSCTVCGRKRTAIEEELEGLYDAYYLELEQFANQGEGLPMLPPPRDFSLRAARGMPSTYGGQPPSRGRIIEHVGDDDDDNELEEGYSDDEVEDDDYSDEPPEDYHNSHEREVADFLTFGNSLQVKGTQLLESLLHRYGNMDLGGILTVADDLLKNDGKRFIEMMEQLAERRMAREEDAREHFTRGYGHPNGSYSHPHSHPPPEEDEFDDDEDEEEDYEDSQDEEYEDEEDQMTEEQRMEEGRRMFQIFAARMFEQRVLSAYKEKVAKERQQKLLEELDEESRRNDEQKAKKAKNAQKKKDKAAQKKQALAEEKARREAEKAAEEAARKEAEHRRITEQKQKAEEKRKQKEAQRKAEEELRLKKEADRQRRLHEQREKQAEQERKAREAKDREKQLKEEQRLKEQDLRVQKEREAQERKEKQERDKREKEARAAKAQKEAFEAKEARDRAKEEKTAQKAAAAAQPAQTQPSPAAKRASHSSAIPATVLPQHPPNPVAYASPKIAVATPVLPKAPTPIRPRQTSQQYEVGPSSSSASQSAASQNPSPHPMTPVHYSPGLAGQQHRKVSTTSTSAAIPQASYPASPTNGRGLPKPFQNPLAGIQPPPGLGQHPPGFPNRLPDPMFSPPGFRPSPNVMIPTPLGIPGPGRGFPAIPMPPPGFPQPLPDQFGINQGFPISRDGPPPPLGHVRQGSSGFEGPGSIKPIGSRPAPIARPSISHSQSQEDQDEETTHLGSRALLDDDEPLEDEFLPGSLRNQPPGPQAGFGASPFLDHSFPLAASSPWGPPAVPAQSFPPPGLGGPGWGATAAPPGFGITSPVLGMSAMRPVNQPRHVVLRQSLCQACRELAYTGDSEGFVQLVELRSNVAARIGDQSITEEDLLDLYDTEGSPSNGGGSFEIKRDIGGLGRHCVRWTPDHDIMNPVHRAFVGAPGEIGSPMTGHASLRGF